MQREDPRRSRRGDLLSGALDIEEVRPCQHHGADRETERSCSDVPDGPPRDLGDRGFEILELTSVFDDIMSAPREGHVQAAHFKLLVDAAGK